MSEQRDRVREWHAKMGQDDPSAPTMPSEADRELRCRLLLEEVQEFVWACGYDVTYAFTTKRATTPDLVAMAHELADVQVVVSGTFSSMGVDDSPVFAEVMQANERKSGGGVDAHGKWKKPSWWEPADVSGVLAKQGWKP